MSRYQATELNPQNSPLVGAFVYVTNQDGSPAVLTDDGGGILTSPLVTDQFGSYYFNAADGFYNIQINVGNLVRRRDFGVAVGSLLARFATGDAFDDGIWNANDGIIDDGIWG